MASRFTALPLSLGESFVLETDVNGVRKVILVDAGQKPSVKPDKHQVIQSIKEHCPEVAGRIDIAICTHQDRDHAGGFPTFVEAWLSAGNRIGEFWLPGAWSTAAHTALRDPFGLLGQLRSGAVEAAESIKWRREVREEVLKRILREVPHTLIIDKVLGDLRREMGLAAVGSDANLQSRQLARHYLTDASPRAQVEHAARSWGFSVEQWQEIALNFEERSLLPPIFAERVFAASRSIGLSFLDPLQTRLANMAIDTAEAIEAIATAAVRFNIPVRWFDYEPFEKGNGVGGGYPGFLVPLNAKEIPAKPPEPDGLRLFLSLTLTRQNVASLVFERVETAEEPGVVFVADSRLAFGEKRPSGDFPRHLSLVERPVIFTAAHHGSRNNDHAYGVLSNWLGPLYSQSIAVRNGGISRQILDGYLKVARRRCAQCIQCNDTKWSQLVQISADVGSWEWPPPATAASCGTPKPRPTKAKAPQPGVRG